MFDQMASALLRPRAVESMVPLPKRKKLSRCTPTPFNQVNGEITWFDPCDPTLRDTAQEYFSLTEGDTRQRNIPIVWRVSDGRVTVFPTISNAAERLQLSCRSLVSAMAHCLHRSHLGYQIGWYLPGMTLDKPLELAGRMPPLVVLAHERTTGARRLITRVDAAAVSLGVRIGKLRTALACQAPMQCSLGELHLEIATLSELKRHHPEWEPNTFHLVIGKTANYEDALTRRHLAFTSSMVSYENESPTSVYRRLLRELPQ